MISKSPVMISVLFTQALATYINQLSNKYTLFSYMYSISYSSNILEEWNGGSGSHTELVSVTVK